MEQNDKIRAEIIGKQISSLLEQSGISIVGLAYAIDMSANHIRTIKNGKTATTNKTIGKIADFFEIEIGVLFSTKVHKLTKGQNINNIRKFYSDNEHNPQFFIQRKGENSVALFLKQTLIPYGFFKDQREVNEVRSFSKSHFKREFTSKELSRELNRLADSGILTKTDKTGNKSIFLFQNA